jgi:hypothetical protein
MAAGQLKRDSRLLMAVLVALNAWPSPLSSISVAF